MKDLFQQIAARLNYKLDDLTLNLKKRLRLHDPIHIVCYRSYGTPEKFYVKGRVLEDEQIQRPDTNDTIFENLLNMYKRFESDEVPGAVLKVSVTGEEFICRTDREGYFVLDIIPQKPFNLSDMWLKPEIRLTDSPLPFPPGLTTHAEVLIPDTDAEYGIISDLDDTVIQTSATNLLAMSRTVFFHNAHTRLPFAGVAEFYKSLQLGRNGKRNNPFFYVSSSPWNLYDLLVDFLELNEIPEGPLLLRDFGFQENKLFGSGHMGHKFKEIEQILLTYPHLNFVLIGDSGQEDPKIYREVVKKYPGRILAIYIRDVQLPEREKIAVEVSEELTGHNVEMIIVDNTVEAADHAAENGLIFREAIPGIIEDKEMDKGEIAGKEN